ncbi:unnamed protein product [Protopolystoma xenopodis]|uniref:Uncharacterized protein n=1 Tax=Protopolystoma xenopodis TaxID=117903 RepID=A0A3S5B6L3_9PLAT|nr:unnamed protein product [Protopolystoma xenopodis]
MRPHRLLASRTRMANDYAPTSTGSPSNRVNNCQISGPQNNENVCLPHEPSVEHSLASSSSFAVNSRTHANLNSTSSPARRTSSLGNYERPNHSYALSPSSSPQLPPISANGRVTAGNHRVENFQLRLDDTVSCRRRGELNVGVETGDIISELPEPEDRTSSTQCQSESQVGTL